LGAKTVRLDALPRPPSEHHAAFLSSRNARTDSFAQWVPLELRQRCHQGGDQFTLRARQIELLATIRRRMGHRHRLSVFANREYRPYLQGPAFDGEAPGGRYQIITGNSACGAN